MQKVSTHCCSILILTLNSLLHCLCFPLWPDGGKSECRTELRTPQLHILPAVILSPHQAQGLQGSNMETDDMSLVTLDQESHMEVGRLVTNYCAGFS